MEAAPKKFDSFPLEDAISDAIITKKCKDPVLSTLIDIAFVTILENRPLKPDLLDEPVLYRRFCLWVKNAIKEADDIQKALEKSALPVGGG